MIRFVGYLPLFGALLCASWPLYGITGLLGAFMTAQVACKTYPSGINRLVGDIETPSEGSARRFEVQA